MDNALFNKSSAANKNKNQNFFRSNQFKVIDFLYY